MSRPMVWWFGVWAAPLVLPVVSGPAAAQVSFEWATVGNPCNAPDLLNAGVGSVPLDIGSVCYTYRIATHKVTNEQYAVFLNSVAAADINNLYNTAMDTGPNGGITRTGSPGKYSYSVIPNMGDKPVGNVSFFDAMRFVNWLQQGQTTGSQNLNATEWGTYLILDGISEEREWRGTYFIPSENEWYKAAYHQPADAGGDADGYWAYATASNDQLPSEPPIASYYGTFGQSTAAEFEWTEGLHFNETGSIGYRKVRGVRSLQVNTIQPVLEAHSIGFRVASRVAGSADFDLDLDVDLRDYQHFQNEMGGPE